MVLLSLLLLLLLLLYSKYFTILPESIYLIYILHILYMQRNGILMVSLAGCEYIMVVYNIYIIIIIYFYK